MLTCFTQVENYLYLAPYGGREAHPEGVGLHAAPDLGATQPQKGDSTASLSPPREGGVLCGTKLKRSLYLTANSTEKQVR